ncbi:MULTISPECIES: hypothetical protein [unclassified Xanthobacter]|nr:MULTISPECIES: hypothetical protein [unclassified Xanthobacter]
MMSGELNLKVLNSQDGELVLAFAEGHIDCQEIAEEDILDAIRRECPWHEDEDEQLEFSTLRVRHFHVTEVPPEGEATEDPETLWLCGASAPGARPVTGVTSLRIPGLDTSRTVPCAHIADWYDASWQANPSIGANLLRHGYRQWAEGRPTVEVAGVEANTLYDAPRW